MRRPSRRRRQPVLGALLGYITDPERIRFQPMNVNFGLLPPLGARLRGRAKKEMMSQRALADMVAWLNELHAAALRADTTTAQSRQSVLAQ